MPVNGESKQKHERSAIVKFNSKSILVFVKTLPRSSKSVFLDVQNNL